MQIRQSRHSVYEPLTLGRKLLAEHVLTKFDEPIRESPLLEVAR